MAGLYEKTEQRRGEPATENDGSKQSGGADLWGIILQLAGDLEEGRPAAGGAWLCVDEAVIKNQIPPDSIPEDVRAAI